MAAADAAADFSGTNPVDAAGQSLANHFDRAMAGYGPWEPAPRLTVAVSGGPDSLALCFLANEWAKSRGGRVDTVTVDHGLRAVSAKEAAQVGAWMAARGMDHTILIWPGVKPETGIQESARAARYALLEAHCRDTGSLHLLVGHHLDDQLETARMRAARQAVGPGLAGMSAVAERPDCRIIRPLLGLGKATLAAYLRKVDQPWLDDPSNLDPAFERARLRTNPLRPAERVSWKARTSRAADSRQDKDRRLADVLAAHCRVHPAGFVLIDPAILDRDKQAASRLLSAAILMVGGGAYAPGRSAMDGLFHRLIHGLAEDIQGAATATLGGCRIGPFMRRGGRWLAVCREAGRCAPAARVNAGKAIVWDGRIGAQLDGPSPMPADLTIGALGEAGWAKIAREIGDQTAREVPPAARYALPALFRGETVLAAPNLRFTKALPPKWRLDLAFCPKRPLAGAGFCTSRDLANAERSIV